MTKFQKFMSVCKPAFAFSIAMFVLCGLAYPFALTGISQAIFPAQANGSILYVQGKAVGSSLIGQTFSDARYMKGRPSAVGYNTYTAEQKEDGSYAGVASGSQNLAPSNPALAERVQADLDAFLVDHPQAKKGEIPADLLTASGSGLDPHISPDSAKVQIPALVKSTGLTQAALEKIVQENTDGKLLGVFGEETVNVLGVNLAIAKELKLIIA